ncbi:hypothetical protein EAO72_07835 [Streptomyces sp. or43]|nr:hypothetical protein EAO72_07835 [Streptomyces sp. or43]
MPQGQAPGRRMWKQGSSGSASRCLGAASVMPAARRRRALRSPCSRAATCHLGPHSRNGRLGPLGAVDAHSWENGFVLALSVVEVRARLVD